MRRPGRSGRRPLRLTRPRADVPRPADGQPRISRSRSSPVPAVPARAASWARGRGPPPCGGSSWRSASPPGRRRVAPSRSPDTPTGLGPACAHRPEPPPELPMRASMRALARRSGEALQSGRGDGWAKGGVGGGKCGEHLRGSCESGSRWWFQQRCSRARGNTAASALQIPIHSSNRKCLVRPRPAGWRPQSIRQGCVHRRRKVCRLCTETRRAEVRVGWGCHGPFIPGESLKGSNAVCAHHQLGSRASGLRS